MTDVVAVQDTLASSPPGNAGIFWTDHLVPFQTSASVVPSGALVPVEEPVAVQAPAAVQDTPNNWLDVDPVGLGVDWTDHFVPFQPSASVTLLPAASVSYPTAVQVLAEVQDTACS